MAIAYIGASNGNSATTPPAHQAGDLLIAFAFRTNTTALPTFPAGFGWTTVAGSTFTANNVTALIATQIATAPGTAFGTWTTNRVICLVFRGASGVGIPTTAGGLSQTITLPALTATSPLSWAVRLYGHRTAAATPTPLPVEPWFTRTSTGFAPYAQARGTTGPLVSSSTNIPADTLTVTSAGSGWIAETIEVLSPPPSAEHVLVVKDARAGSRGRTALLAQEIALGAVRSARSVTRTAAVLLSTRVVLGIARARSATDAGRPRLVQEHRLTVQGLRSTSDATQTTALTQRHPLVIGTARAPGRLGRPRLVQRITLDAQGTRSATRAARIRLAQTVQLVTNGARSTTRARSVRVVQVAVLVVLRPRAPTRVESAYLPGPFVAPPSQRLTVVVAERRTLPVQPEDRTLPVRP